MRKKEQGLSVLAFPCNQFGAQGSSPIEEIVAFCSTHYDVTFDLFNKIEVNGPNQSPLYAKRFPHKVQPDSPEVVTALKRALGS